MIYLDIETLDFFADPHIKALPRPLQLVHMRFGCAVTYDARADEWLTWGASAEYALAGYILDSGLTIVGWNIWEFDIPLLALHTDPPCQPPPCIDLMLILRQATKAATGTERWYSLQDAAMANLGRGKSGNGQHAAEWLRSGDPALMAQAHDYCRQDVQLVIDLFAVAQVQGLLCPARRDRGEAGDMRVWIDEQGKVSRWQWEC